MFAKLGKKIIAFFAVALLGLSVTACIDSSKSVTLDEAQANVDAVIKAIVYDSTVLNDVTANLTAVKQNANYPDVKIEWSSSEEDIVSFATNAQGIHQMVINRPKGTDARVVDGYAPVTVTVTASQVVADGTATANKTLSLKVKALDSQFFGTVAEVVANYLNTLKEANTTLNEAGNSSGDKYVSIYSVTYGRVEYIYSKGFYITDGDAGIYVYGNTEGLKLGDLVKVSGQVYAYYGVIEFGKEINVEVLSATDKVVDLDGNEVRTQDSFVRATYEEKGIKEYTDALSASYANNYTGSKYEAGLVSDAAAFANYSGATYTLTGQLVKEDLATGDSYALVDPIYGTKIALYHYCTDDATETLDALDSKNVQIQVVTVDRYSSNAMFRVLWNGSTITEVAAPELTDQQKADKAAYEIENTVLPSLYYNGDTFTAPTTTVEDVTVTWSESTYVVDGKIVATEAANVTLTATVTCGDATATAEITFAVEAKEIITTIADFISGLTTSESELYTIKGTVIAVFGSYKNYYVQDETGTILVYKSCPSDVTEGDVVKMSVKAKLYYGLPEVTYVDSYVVVESKELTLPTPTVKTIDEIVAWTTETAEFSAYLQVTGKLIDDSGYYLTDGTNKLYLNYSDTSAIEAYAGTDKELTLNVYFYTYNSSKDVPHQVVFCGREGEYVLPQLSDAEQAALLLDGIEVAESASTDFTLPEVEGVVWSIKEGTAATLDGHTVTVVRPEAGQEDATVVFTATYTLNDVDYTKDFTVTVPAAEADGTTTYTHTFATGQLSTAGGEVTLSNVAWTASTATYIGFDSNNGRGAQIGKSSSATTNWSLSSTAFTDKVSQVVVNAAMASGGDATLTVKVNGVQVGETVSLTTTATNYTFDLSEATAGTVEIIYACTVKAMYIGAITVVTVAE